MQVRFSRSLCRYVPTSAQQVLLCSVWLFFLWGEGSFRGRACGQETKLFLNLESEKLQDHVVFVVAEVLVVRPSLCVCKGAFIMVLRNGFVETLLCIVW